jgi:GrpB-like predicted nucleotidyltransferase (UPF0157 family)
VGLIEQPPVVFSRGVARRWRTLGVGPTDPQPGRGDLWAVRHESEERWIERLPKTQRRGLTKPSVVPGPSRPPTTEERLRQATIGEPQRHDGPITLCEYDPNWPKLFSREERRIRGALGDRAILLEHVGSTAVPGLAAKPIVDILLVVANSANESSYVPALEAEGYVLRIREPEWHQHRLLKGPDTNVNLHVLSAGGSESGRMLTFRDALRTNPETRERYAKTKRELARRTWKYVQEYADAKSEVVEAILAGAPEATARK